MMKDEWKTRTIFLPFILHPSSFILSSLGGTMMALNWHSAREIGELLFEKYDTLNPLTVRFTDLHKWVLDLEDFEGKPQESNEKLLEAIQMAWYEEWKGEYGDA
jgi:FeS assembly protein IscX